MILKERAGKFELAIEILWDVFGKTVGDLASN